MAVGYSVGWGWARARARARGLGLGLGLGHRYHGVHSLPWMLLPSYPVLPYPTPSYTVFYCHPTTSYLVLHWILLPSYLILPSRTHPIPKYSLSYLVLHGTLLPSYPVLPSPTLTQSYQLAYPVLPYPTQSYPSYPHPTHPTLFSTAILPHGVVGWGMSVCVLCGCE